MLIPRLISQMPFLILPRASKLSTRNFLIQLSNLQINKMHFSITTSFILVQQTLNGSTIRSKLPIVFCHKTNIDHSCFRHFNFYRNDLQMSSSMNPSVINNQPIPARNSSNVQVVINGQGKFKRNNVWLFCS